MFINSESQDHLLRYFPEYAEASDAREILGDKTEGFHKEVRCEEGFGVDMLYHRGNLVREEVRHSNGHKNVTVYLTEKNQQYNLLMKMTNHREKLANGSEITI